jgi:hypothetical protein
MFEFVKSYSGENTPSAVKLPSTASEVYTEGETLKMASGALTKASATDVATHICAQAYTAPSSGNADIYAYPILPHHEYKTTFDADASAVTAGTKLTIGTGGATLTATATGGTVTLTKKLGTGASGTSCLCRFI